SGVCEISLSINPGKSREVTLELFNNGNEKVTMVYDTSARTFSFDRRESGLTDFSKDFPAVTVAPTFNNGETITLDIFVDTSSIEVFGNNGEFAMTNLVFPRNPYTTLSVKSDANARISGLNIHAIK
ncbi:MAG: GH32 C-terminal domain-containing protein, partial [Muribaculaceae bacterium]|nr:GH32 C-terminal domain-containing protein [Muribaculaceae bacterium]